MPVYEFYCADCHVIFNFLSRRIAPDRRPSCPKCGKQELNRQVSLFAYSKGRTEEPLEGMPNLDDEKMERAMMALAGDMEGIDENDPRAMATFMRKFSDLTGMNLGSGFEEAMRRLESGDDPEKIEEEMGDLFDEDNPFGKEGLKGLRRRYAAPAHDETLYPLE